MLSSLIYASSLELVLELPCCCGASQSPRTERMQYTSSRESGRPGEGSHCNCQLPTANDRSYQTATKMPDLAVPVIYHGRASELRRQGRRPSCACRKHTGGFSCLLPSPRKIVCHTSLIHWEDASGDQRGRVRPIVEMTHDTRIEASGNRRRARDLQILKHALRSPWSKRACSSCEYASELVAGLRVHIDGVHATSDSCAPSLTSKAPALQGLVEHVARVQACLACLSLQSGSKRHSTNIALPHLPLKNIG